MGFRGYLVLVYWRCPASAYGFQVAFGMGVLGLPCEFGFRGASGRGLLGLPCIWGSGGICCGSTGGNLFLGFKGHLVRAYLECSAIRLQRTFAVGTGLLEMPCVRFSGGIWYGPTGGTLCMGFKGHLARAYWGCPV